jgi:mannose-6-phosphate isomerase-like protein (cupin superfamily)
MRLIYQLIGGLPVRYLFRPADGERWGWEGVAGVTLSTGGDSPEVSGATLAVTGRHGRVKSTVNTRAYFVYAGAGTFEVDGEQLAVATGDLILVPRGVPYDFWSAEMHLLVIHVPAFDPAGEEST